MRIGYDAKRLFNNFTGLGNYSRFVVEALATAFPEDSYFLFSPKVRKAVDTDFFFSNSAIQRIEPSPLLKFAKLSSAWRTLLGWRLRADAIDIYHGLSHELPYAIPAAIKKVVTVHDLIFYRYPEYYSAIDVAIYKSKLRHACKVADTIVAISNQTKQDLIDFLFIDPNKIVVVYQGCHPNFHAVKSSESKWAIKEKYALPDSYILNVGTVEPRKNALLILKAFNQLKDQLALSLVIVGKPTKYKELLLRYIHKNGISHRVHFLHSVAFEDLPAIYQQAKVFVYPSFFEGFGIPLIEAIASKLPVISSTGSCFMEAAGPGAAYVDPSDDVALANTLRTILSDEETRQTNIAATSLYVQRFTPEKIAHELHAVYAKLLPIR